MYGYGLDKVYHIRYNHRFRQTCSGRKFDCVVCSIYHVYKIQAFHQFMKGLGYELKINTQYFELTMQTKYVR